MPDWSRGIGSGLRGVEQAAGLEPDNSVLGNVARALSRPGYIARNLLRGDVAAAAKNNLQLYLDLFTGGWLNRNFSLARFFTETGDITTAEERPEFSDLLESWGAGAPAKGSFGRIGLDVVGGIVTDPLTLLGGIGGAGRAAAFGGAKAAQAGSQIARLAGRTSVGAAAAEDAAMGALRHAPELRAVRASLGLPEDMLLGGATLETTEAAAKLGADLGRAKRALQRETGAQIMRGVLAGSEEAKALGRSLVDDAANEFFPQVAAKRGLAKSPTLPDSVRESLRLAGVADPRVASYAQVSAAFDDVLGQARMVAGPRQPGVLTEADRLGNARSSWDDAWGAAQEKGRSAVGVGSDGDFMRFTGMKWQEPLVTMGQRFLEGRGLIPKPGIAYFGIPFTRAQVAMDTAPTAARYAARALAGPLGSRTFFDAAGAVPRALYRWAPPNLQRWIDAGAAELHEQAMKVFSRDELMKGKVPEGLRALYRKLSGEGVGRRWTYAMATAKVFDGVDAGLDQAMGKAMLEEESELWNLAKAVEGRPPVGPGVSATIDDELEALIRARGGDDDLVNALRGSVQGVVGRTPVPLRAGAFPWEATLKAPAARMATWLARQKVIEKVTAETGAPAEKIGALFDGFVDNMAKVQNELVSLGVWKRHDLEKLLYVPHQASWELRGFLAESPHNEKFRAGLLDVFTKSRDYDTIDDLRRAFEKVAADNEVPLPMEAQLAHAVGPGMPMTVETSLAGLMVKRLMAHTHTVERFKLVKEAASRFKIEANATNVDRYVNAMLEPLGPRASTIQKILGGGKWYTKIAPREGQSMREALRPFMEKGRDVEVIDGAPHAVYELPGLNALLKPAMTIGLGPFIWPSFHMRNLISNAVLGAMNPELGPKGVAIMLRTLRDAPVLQKLPGMTPTDAGLVLRALRSPEGLTPELQARLATLKIGNYDAPEVIKAAREGVLGRDFSEAEVFNGIGRWQELALAAGDDTLRKLERLLSGRDKLSRHLWDKRLVSTMRALVRWPAAVGSYLEDSQRLGSFMHMVGRGVDPQTAIHEVNRTFVDYKFQSAADRMVRDVLPFARFSLASAPVTAKAVMERPGVFNATARPLLTQAGNQEGTVLPETLLGRPAVPAGFDADGNPVYATSLGLPFEAPADLASIATQGLERGVGRVIGGALTPPVRATVEGITGHNFYFGDDVASFKQAPRFFPKALTREVELPGGKKIQEVPAWVNHWLLGATPASRFRTEFDNLLDSRKSILQRAWRGATGVRFQTADQEREARRVLERWLRSKVETGEVGVIENFFSRGEVGPEVEQALKSLQQVKKQQKAGR